MVKMEFPEIKNKIGYVSIVILLTILDRVTALKSFESHGTGHEVNVFCQMFGAHLGVTLSSIVLIAIVAFLMSNQVYYTCRAYSYWIPFGIGLGTLTNITVLNTYINMFFCFVMIASAVFIIIHAKKVEKVKWKEEQYY